MGSRLKDAFDKAMKSEQSQNLQGEAQDAFDSLTKGAERVSEDAKSGELGKTVRKSLHDTLHELDQKLGEYTGPSGLDKDA